MSLLKDLVFVYKERAKLHRAMRLLKDQEWSLEFLVALLNKAVAFKKANCQMILRNVHSGQELLIRADIPMTQDIAQHEKNLDVLAGNITLEQLLDAAEIQGTL